MKTLKLKGTVSSGEGTGKKFVSLSWVKKQLTEKLGFTPYPGTLNLILTPTQIAEKQKLKEVEAIKIDPEENFCRGRCFKALVMGRVQGALIIPEIPNYPENLVEILAPVNLRRALGLKDGDVVDLTVFLDLV